MTPGRPIAGVVFDLDGVLIDSRANMALAWATVREACGYPHPFEAYFAGIGRPFADILRGMGITERLDEAERVFMSASRAAFGDIGLYPGTRAGLERLRRAGFRLGIVTSKDAGRTALAVDRIGPDLFDAVQAPAPGLAGKPAPDQLLAVAAGFGLPAARLVYVGDMAVDAEAAAGAGALYAHAGWGYGPIPATACLTAPSLSELADLLLRLTAAGTGGGSEEACPATPSDG